MFAIMLNILTLVFRPSQHVRNAEMALTIIRQIAHARAQFRWIQMCAAKLV